MTTNPTNPTNIDVFPAKATITLSNTTTVSYPKARVLATIPGNLEIWVEDTQYPHQVTQAFTFEIIEQNVKQNTMNFHYPRHRQVLTVKTNGTTIEIQALGGCGCGSRLRQLPINNKHQALSNDQAQAQLISALRGHFPNAS